MPLRAVDTGSRISEENTQSRIREFECPACRGQGVQRGPQSDMPWFDCRYCGATGAVTEQQAEDWPQTWGS